MKNKNMIEKEEIYLAHLCYDLLRDIELLKEWSVENNSEHFGEIDEIKDKLSNLIIKKMGVFENE